jgi:hypothetical protein
MKSVATFARPQLPSEEPVDPVKRYVPFDPVGDIADLKEAIRRIDERLAALEALVAALSNLLQQPRKSFW